MTVEMNFYFRQAWKDERLRYDEEIIRGWNDSELSSLAEKDIPEHIYILPEYIKTKIFIRIYSLGHLHFYWLHYRF